MLSSNLLHVLPNGRYGTEFSLKFWMLFFFHSFKTPFSLPLKKVSLPYTEHRHVASEEKWHFIIHTDGRQAI
jgi:hypothetical protein